MTSRSLRNPGRLSRSHSGICSASLCCPDFSCGCIVRKELGRHQVRKDTKVVAKQGTLALIGWACPDSPECNLMSIYWCWNGRHCVSDSGRQSGWDSALLLWKWEELEMMTRRLSLTINFRKEVFPVINSSTGQHVRMIAFASCFVYLSCHLLGRLGLTHKEVSTRCHRRSSSEQGWHLQSALIAQSD